MNSRRARQDWNHWLEAGAARVRWAAVLFGTLALKEGAPTASPEKMRSTLSAEISEVELNKLGN